MNFYTILCAHFMTNFSFYTLKSFLVLYLTQQMRLDIAEALLLFGNIMGLAYFTGLWNARLADKYFPPILSILLGIFLLIIGLLIVPILSGDNKILGFSFICFSSGFFKPSLLAEMSRPGKDRPQKATTYYYAIGNLSTIASGIIAGLVINFFSADYVFFLLAVLLIPMLYIGFSLPKNILTIERLKGLALIVLIGGGVFIFLNNNVLLKTLLPFLVFGTMAYLLKDKTLGQGNILLALGIFTIFAMFIEIFSGATTLFIEHHVYRSFGSYIIPTSFFHSINPFLLIVLTGLGIFVKSQKNISPLAIFFRSFLLLTLSVALLVVCVFSFPSLQLIFLMFIILFQTMAEFLLVPQILEILGKGARDENRQQTMSLWLGCIAGAHILASHLSGIYLTATSVPTKEEFFIFYLILGGIALFISFVLGLIYYFRQRECLSYY